MQERRYDLDCLRVFAIILLHFFHSAMPFISEWSWHIKNPQLSNLLLECNYFLSRWRMPLLFVISGVGTTFVISRISGAQFAIQRLKRLLVPLFFGIIIIVPPQVYFERIFNGNAYGSLFEFYPSIFSTGPYPEGNFSWHHLWFIAYLLIYSLFVLPMLLWLKSEKGKSLLEHMGIFLQRFGLYWLALPTFAASLLLFWYPVETHALIDDWATLARYFTYFAAGCLIGNNTVIWKSIADRRRSYLRTAFLCTIFINYLRWNGLEPEWEPDAANIAYLALLILGTWSWLLAFFGYAKTYLNRGSRLLTYANEGVYAFYILHQTVIVILAFYVVQVEETIISKYIFLSIVSFWVTLGLYEFLVRPYTPVRFLFGMKPKK